MENLWMAYTNLYGGLAVDTFYRRGYLYTSWILMGSLLSSFIYHYIETEKHLMPGGPHLNPSTSWQRFWLNVDRFFAVLSFLLIFRWESFLKYWHYCLVAAVCLGISEIPFRYEKWCYMFFHTIWHLSAFHLAFLFALDRPDLSQSN